MGVEEGSASPKQRRHSKPRCDPEVEAPSEVPDRVVMPRSCPITVERFDFINFPLSRHSFLPFVHVVPGLLGTTFSALPPIVSGQLVAMSLIPPFCLHLVDWASSVVSRTLTTLRSRVEEYVARIFLVLSSCLFPVYWSSSIVTGGSFTLSFAYGIHCMLVSMFVSELLPILDIRHHVI